MSLYVRIIFLVFFVFSHINTVRTLKKILIPPDSCFRVIKWLHLLIKVGMFLGKIMLSFRRRTQARVDLHWSFDWSMECYCSPISPAEHCLSTAHKYSVRLFVNTTFFKMDRSSNNSSRLVQGLNAGAEKSILEEFLLAFIHDGSDSEWVSDQDEDDDDDDDGGIVFDQVNTSLCSESDNNNQGDESGGNAGPGGVQLGFVDSLVTSEEVTNVAPASDRTEEMTKIRNFDCKCKEYRKENSQLQPVSCSKKLDPEMICDTRMETAALTREQRDMFLLGIIKTCMNDSEMTQSTKQLNGKRKFIRSTYMVNTTVVCRATFLFVYG